MRDAISQLKEDIGQVTKRAFNTPQDFTWLSDEVGMTVHEHVTAITLRHFWGYGCEPTTPRQRTLDTLARFLQYADFTDYCTKYNEQRDGGSSYFSRQEVLSARDLKPGDRLSLQWEPGRKCIVRCLGNAKFTVEAVEKSHLHVDDIFTCYLFVKGEPAYLSDLISHGQHYPLYVIGTRGGVTARPLSKED